MELYDFDKKPPPQMPSARDWWGVVGFAIAVVLISALWTFWA